MANERFYFHLLDGRRVGPLALEILQRMADSGEIGPKARLKRESDGRRFRASQKLRFDAQDEKKEEKRSATASDKSDGRRALSKENVGTAPFGDAALRKNGSERSSAVEVAPADVLNPFGELTRSSGVVDQSVAVLGTRLNKRSDKKFYVYDVLGRRCGPYSVVDLKRLAVEGRIEQNTTLETLFGKRGRAVEICELAFFFQANETNDPEKFDGSQIFLIVFLCVLGAFLAVGVIVWALSHPLLLGRFLVYGAFGVLALGAAWYIGKGAYEYISEHSDAFLKTLKILLAVGAAIGGIVVLWTLFGVWLLLAPLGILALLVAAGSCN
ncbi:MAG: hypothetical protein IJE97_11805 [Thermoguttaceae bacterium]|nr:hypothetical protein [Thermoguttaceae bacterium]MBQ6829472.1 hypothetical protein [Thermoguttaceae bacterium]MBQ7110879.1 hypothetical protein [Thermoguttaceae bacterium]